MPCFLRFPTLLALALLSLAAHARAAHAGAAARPNVLLIVVDDLGYGEPGCYGGAGIPTPHLDSLARDGIRFTQGYVTASFCAPSRAGLLTGRYQTRFGFESNPVGARNSEPGVGLPVGERTLATVLRDHGYATALIGKWHLGGTAPFHPLRRGFDEFFGFLHEGHYFVPPPWEGVTTWLRRRALPDGGQGRWTSPDGRLVWTTHMGHFEPDYDADNPILRHSQPVEEKRNLTTAFTDEAIDFIERRRHQPFFLYLPYNAVHSPLQAEDGYLQRFRHIEDIHRRIFAAMTAHLDDSLGRVFAKLDEAGLRERTLVIFLSDNGGATRELTSSNGSLRGGKGTLFEGGVRVPFLLRWPGHLPGGRTFDAPVISLDLFDTVLAAAGISASGGAPRDGVNLLPFLRGERTGAPHETLYWRMSPRAALRHGDWKIVREGAARGATPAWQLFNVAADPAESRDLAASEPARLRDLVERWNALDAEMVRDGR